MDNNTFQAIRLMEEVLDRPIAFNRAYVRIGCGINGALMLSQLVYWSKRSNDPDLWIYKTHAQWTEETGLTRREQEFARKTLKELGFITEIKKGVPCKIYFKVEHENLYKSLLETTESLAPSQLHESAILDARFRHSSCTNPPNKLHVSAQLDARIRQSITENTTENTTKSVEQVRDAEANTHDTATAEKQNPAAEQKPQSESVTEVEHNPIPEKQNSESATAKAADSKNEKFSPMSKLLALGVSHTTAKDYIALRNKKRVTVTEDVIKSVVHQAHAAMLTNDMAFRVIVMRGWQTFKATWNWQDTVAELEALDKGEAAQANTIPETPKTAVEYKTVPNEWELAP